MINKNIPFPRSGLRLRLRHSIRDKWLYWILLGLFCTLSVILLWNRIFIWIETGEGGVIYKPFWGGTVTDQVFTEGLHVIYPFNRMTVYDVRMQVLRHDFNVLTSNGLQITLKLAVRYRPIFDLLGVLHQEIGPDYPNKIILPQIESVLRKGLGTRSPEDIYTNKEQLLTTLVKSAIDEIGQKYVMIDDIIIKEIALPKKIQESIEEKTVQEQVLKSYEFRLKTAEKEAERKRKESEGIRDYAKNISETMTNNVLRWRGVQATLKLAASQNTKIVIIGGKDGLPLILNTGDSIYSSYSASEQSSVQASKQKSVSSIDGGEQ